MSICDKHYDLNTNSYSSQPHQLAEVDVVLYGLKSVVLYPNSYKGKGSKVSWQVEEFENATICGKDGKIVCVCKTEDLHRHVVLDNNTKFINGHGLVAVPGFVDSHTHLVYAGDRADEFEMRVAGKSYIEILAAGGGILKTVKAVRELSEDELYNLAYQRMLDAIRWGTTTIEIKTGYGLNLETEMKMIRVIERLKESLPARIVGTFMGAHAIPHEFKNEPNKYVDEICNKMIPEVAKSNVIKFNDVFCELKAFNVEQSRRVLERGLEFSLIPKVHADEINIIGALDLAIEIGAISADHLIKTNIDGINKLKDTNVIPTLLPATSTFLMEKEHAKARAMIEAGLPVAIASDHNPGSSQFLSMPLVQTLAMLNLKMSCTEALIASTLHSAYALGLGEFVGSIERGKYFDIVLLNAPSYKYIAYSAGQNVISKVIIGGKLVYEN